MKRFKNQKSIFYAKSKSLFISRNLLANWIFPSNLSQYQVKVKNYFASKSYFSRQIKVVHQYNNTNPLYFHDFYWPNVDCNFLVKSKLKSLKNKAEKFAKNYLVFGAPRCCPCLSRRAHRVSQRSSAAEASSARVWTQFGAGVPRSNNVSRLKFSSSVLEFLQCFQKTNVNNCPTKSSLIDGK